MIGYEIYNQKEGIDKINKHFLHQVSRFSRGRHFSVKNNYILTSKHSNLLTFTYVRQFMERQFYQYSTSDVSSIISKYVSNNSFDFIIDSARQRCKRASIFVDINGVDLSTNSQNKNLKPITFSVRHIQRPRKNCRPLCRHPSEYRYVIKIGLLAFNNNLKHKIIDHTKSNKRYKRNEINQRYKRNKKNKKNKRNKSDKNYTNNNINNKSKGDKYLTRQDFLQQFGRHPQSFLSFHQGQLRAQGFSENVSNPDDHVSVIMSDWDLSYEHARMELKVDLMNNEGSCLKINGNNSIDLQKEQLNDDMIYIFTLDIRRCYCNPFDYEKDDAICQLKVEQRI